MKNRLLDDAGTLMLVANVPYIPRRRDGDSPIRLRNIDDIVTIVSNLDEQKALDKLPRYVSESPDNMPLVRLVAGDVKILIIWL